MLNFSDKYRLEVMKSEWEFESKMDQLMEQSPAHKDYYGAVLESRKSAKNDELLPDLNSRFKVEYTARQGIKAACLASEGVDTISRVQLSTLKRLDRIQLFQHSSVEASTMALALLGQLRRLAWGAIGLLLYIAYRVS